MKFGLELISADTLWEESLAITPLARRSIAAAVNAYLSENLIGDGTVGEEGPEQTGCHRPK
jgi:hypothetical protein